MVVKSTNFNDSPLYYGGLPSFVDATTVSIKAGYNSRVMNLEIPSFDLTDNSNWASGLANLQSKQTLHFFAQGGQVKIETSLASPILEGRRKRIFSFQTNDSAEIRDFNVFALGYGYILEYNKPVLDSTNKASSLTYIEYDVSLPDEIELSPKIIVNANRSGTRYAFIAGELDRLPVGMSDVEANIRTTSNNSTYLNTFELLTTRNKVYIKSNVAAAWDNFYLQTQSYADYRTDEV